jgi:CitMHS family citrate-Mg2+:H+ or citrate-Ca2+:H+ symporter
MSVLGMTCLVNIASGIMNISPWGGPTARAAAALHVDALEIFMPMIPGMLIGAGCLVFTAVVLGRKERARLGVIHLEDFHNGAMSLGHGSAEECEGNRRPEMFWLNLILTLALITGLILGAMPIQILFMVGFAIAIMLNYPNIEQQKARIAAHATNVLAVTAVIFAAGIFTGILSGTGMVDSMAKSLLHVIPPSFGPFLAFFMSNDAFYFGILPVIAQTAAQYGITPLEIARASVVGQPVHLLSPLVPSLYLLVALAKVDLGDHQRFALKWAILASFGLLAGGLLFGAFPFYQVR